MNYISAGRAWMYELSPFVMGADSRPIPGNIPYHKKRECLYIHPIVYAAIVKSVFVTLFPYLRGYDLNTDPLTFL